MDLFTPIVCQTSDDAIRPLTADEIEVVAGGDGNVPPPPPPTTQPDRTLRADRVYRK